MSKRLSKSIRAGLEDILLYKQGKLKLDTELIEIPEPPVYKKKKKKNIRKSH